MIEQNGLIGLLYCGLVAPASLLILVRIYVLFVDARESEKKKKEKKKKKKKKELCCVLLLQITMTNKRLKSYNKRNIT